MTRFLTIAALSLLAATAGCKRPEKAPEASPAIPSSSAAPEITEALDPATLERLAFQASWGAPPPVRRQPSQTSREAAGLLYKTGKLVALGGDRYAFVSSGALDDAAHVDAGALAIHYLKRTATGFERIGAWPEFEIGGAFGAAPDWILRTDLTPAPALLTEAGGTWQGYTCSWSDVIELTPEGPVKRAENIPVSYDDSGAAMDEKDAKAMTGVVGPGEKGRSFVVRYTGDRRADVTYALSGLKYVAASKPDLLTC